MTEARANWTKMSLDDVLEDWDTHHERAVCGEREHVRRMGAARQAVNRSR